MPDLRWLPPLSVFALVALSACGGGAANTAIVTTSSPTRALSVPSEPVDLTPAGDQPAAGSATDDAGETEPAGGPAGGVVAIDGVAYRFEAEICISEADVFVASGPGLAPDGTPAWVEVSANTDVDLDGDGSNDLSVDISVRPGVQDVYGEVADGVADFTVTKIDAGDLQSGEDITIERDGATVSGAGSIGDNNGVAIPFGELAPMTFEATC